MTAPYTSRSAERQDKDEERQHTFASFLPLFASSLSLISSRILAVRRFAYLSLGSASYPWSCACRRMVSTEADHLCWADVLTGSSLGRSFRAAGIMFEFSMLTFGAISLLPRPSGVAIWDAS
jgi:hypothetical protein